MKQKVDGSIPLYWVLRIITIPLPFAFAYMLLLSFIDPTFSEELKVK